MPYWHVSIKRWHTRLLTTKFRIYIIWNSADEVSRWAINNLVLIITFFIKYNYVKVNRSTATYRVFVPLTDGNSLFTLFQLSLRIVYNSGSEQSSTLRNFVCLYSVPYNALIHMQIKIFRLNSRAKMFIKKIISDAYNSVILPLFYLYYNRCMVIQNALLCKDYSWNRTTIYELNENELRIHTSFLLYCQDQRGTVYYWVFSRLVWS